MSLTKIRNSGNESYTAVLVSKYVSRTLAVLWILTKTSNEFVIVFTEAYIYMQ